MAVPMVSSLLVYAVGQPGSTGYLLLAIAMYCTMLVLEIEYGCWFVGTKRRNHHRNLEGRLEMETGKRSMYFTASDVTITEHDTVEQYSSLM